MHYFFWNQLSFTTTYIHPSPHPMPSPVPTLLQLWEFSRNGAFLKTLLDFPVVRWPTTAELPTTQSLLSPPGLEAWLPAGLLCFFVCLFSCLFAFLLIVCVFRWIFLLGGGRPKRNSQPPNLLSPKPTWCLARVWGLTTGRYGTSNQLVKPVIPNAIWLRPSNGGTISTHPLTGLHYHTAEPDLISSKGGSIDHRPKKESEFYRSQTKKTQKAKSRHLRQGLANMVSKMMRPEQQLLSEQLRQLGKQLRGRMEMGRKLSKSAMWGGVATWNRENGSFNVLHVGTTSEGNLQHIEVIPWSKTICLYPVPLR